MIEVATHLGTFLLGMLLTVFFYWNNFGYTRKLLNAHFVCKENAKRLESNQEIINNPGLSLRRDDVTEADIEANGY